MKQNTFNEMPSGQAVYDPHTQTKYHCKFENCAIYFSSIIFNWIKNISVKWTELTPPAWNKIKSKKKINIRTNGNFI